MEFDGIGSVKGIERTVVESCFWGHSYSLVQTLVVRCIVQPQYTSSVRHKQTDNQTDGQTAKSRSYCMVARCAAEISQLPSLQRVSIACYAERCISYGKSVRLSVRPSHAGTESKRLKLRSWGLHWRIAP